MNISNSKQHNCQFKTKFQSFEFSAEAAFMLFTSYFESIWKIIFHIISVAVFAVNLYNYSHWDIYIITHTGILCVKLSKADQI